MTDSKDVLFALAIGAVAVILAIAGLVLPESSCSSTFPYGNLTDVPSTFPYGNLTGVPYITNGTNGLDFNYTGTIFLFNGSQGIQGIQGIQGEIGYNGSQGIQGIQGIKGDTGDVSGYYDQALNTTSSPTFAGLTLNGNLTTSYYIDGVDISALLLKTTKVTDLATIWDKTTKIVYGDTNFVDQEVKTTNTPTFGGVIVSKSGAPSILFRNTAGSDDQYGGWLDYYSSSWTRRWLVGVGISSTLSKDYEWYQFNPTGLRMRIKDGGEVEMFSNVLVADTPYNIRIRGGSQYIDFGDRSSSFEFYLGRTAPNLLRTDASFQAAGYKSSDGTSGATGDVTVLTALPSTFTTMHFKNGLFTGTG